MKKFVIVVAGGKGLRMGGDLPKQFIPLNNKPVLMHTLQTFYQWDSSCEIISVIPEEHAGYWKMLCDELDCTIPHKIVFGGETRYQSVKNALSEIREEGCVAVHDGVRPFVSPEVITNCFSAVQAFGAAIPVIPVIESVREITDENESKPFDRERLRIVQTPQVFRTEILKKSYENPYNKLFTDDASVVEAAGYKIQLVRGNPENIKITTPMDLKVAEILARKIG